MHQSTLSAFSQGIGLNHSPQMKSRGLWVLSFHRVLCQRFQRLKECLFSRLPLREHPLLHAAFQQRLAVHSHFKRAKKPDGRRPGCHWRGCHGVSVLSQQYTAFLRHELRFSHAFSSCSATFPATPLRDTVLTVAAERIEFAALLC